MTLRKITCPDLAQNAVFIADVDEMIRCPNKEYEVVCVASYDGRTVKPALLTLEDGKWRFDKVSDPAGTLQALVGLAKRWLSRRNINRQLSNKRARIFQRTVEYKYTPIDDDDDGRWALVANWEAWNYRGLQWKERQAEMKKLGCPKFERMSRTTFISICRRELKLKYLPRKSDATKTVILRHHKSSLREQKGLHRSHDSNRITKKPKAPRRAETS